MSNYGLISAAVKTARLRPAARTVVYGAYFHSLFKGVSTSEAVDTMSAVLGDFTPQFSKLNEFTRSAGHLLTVVKPAMFAVLALQMRPAQCRQHGWDAFRYPITKEDASVIDDVLTYAPLRSTLRGYLSEGMRVRSLDNIDKLITSTLLDKGFQDYMKKFIHRKMYFMTGGSPAKFAELLGELQLTALYALRRAYPKWSSHGHMLAIAKTAAHNAGQNAIIAAASDKRRHLVKEHDGTYSAVNVAIDASDAVMAIAHRSDSMVADLSGASLASGADSDTLRSLRSLLEGAASTDLRPKQLAYLRLLIGTPDAAFSEHLGAPNAEAVDTMNFDVYNKRVCSYMRIPEPAAQSFLRSLAEYV